MSHEPVWFEVAKGVRNTVGASGNRGLEREPIVREDSPPGSRQVPRMLGAIARYHRPGRAHIPPPSGRNPDICHEDIRPFQYCWHPPAWRLCASYSRHSQRVEIQLKRLIAGQGQGEFGLEYEADSTVGSF